MTLNLPFFRQLAKALAKQFGDNCEVVLHDLTSTDIEHSVVLVENGHVTHRAVGDGPSHVVLEAMKAMGSSGFCSNRSPGIPDQNRRWTYFEVQYNLYS